MRQNVSSTTLSPLPPYPTSSPPKEPPAPPARSAPSPGPPTPAEESVDMRATHIRPRTAPPSPERPGTAYSTRSTIRQVEPSPDSLSNALAQSLAHGGTPAPGRAFEPFPAFNPSQDDESADDEPGMHIPSTEPWTDIPEGLSRGATPSARKSRSCSPQKSRSQSPRKHRLRTPTLPARQESPSSTYSAVESGTWDAPDTPSPIPREQQREAYAPLQVRRPIAEASSEGELEVGNGTDARSADGMREMEEQRVSKAPAGDVRRSNIDVPKPVKRVVGPLAPHIVQAMAQPQSPSPCPNQTPSRVSAVQKLKQVEAEPVRQTSVSRRSDASGASGASKHSIFSTLGRDELERKKPIVEEDEGPFAKATSMQDLERRRRRVSEGTKEGGEEDGRRKVCGMRCVVM